MATPKSSAVISYCAVLFSFLLFSLSTVTYVGATTCSAFPARVTVKHTGFTRARAVIDIVSEVSGRCTKVLADVGQAIDDSGVFASVDPSFILLELKANALSIQKAQRQLRFDQEQLDRYDQLLAGKSSSQSRLDALLLQRDQTKLLLEELQTTAKKLKETLGHYSIPAPPGWLVMTRNIEPGGWINQGRILGRVGDYSALIIPLALTQEELTALSKEAVLVYFPAQSLAGKAFLYRRSPGFDQETRKLRVELILSPETVEALDFVQGGIRVDVSFSLLDPMRSFLVPEAAVSERYEEHWLTRLDGTNLRVVKLGPAATPSGESGAWVRVAGENLQAGDQFQCP